jgi:chaperonin GroEL (HSP60 family)
VIVLSHELVKHGNRLMASLQLHPMTVIAGLLASCKQATSFLSTQLARPIDQQIDRQWLVHSAATALASKSVTLAKRTLYAEMAVDSVVTLHQRMTAACDINSATALTPQVLDQRMSFVCIAGHSSIEQSYIVYNGCAVLCASTSISRFSDTQRHINDARIFVLDGKMIDFAIARVVHVQSTAVCRYINTNCASCTNTDQSTVSISDTVQPIDGIVTSSSRTASGTSTTCCDRGNRLQHTIH